MGGEGRKIGNNLHLMPNVRFEFGSLSLLLLLLLGYFCSLGSTAATEGDIFLFFIPSSLGVAYLKYFSLAAEPSTVGRSFSLAL